MFCAGGGQSRFEVFNFAVFLFGFRLYLFLRFFERFFFCLLGCFALRFFKGDTICQNYGYKDRRVSEKEKEFIEKWIAWVRAGSRRPKKKKTASAA